MTYKQVQMEWIGIPSEPVTKPLTGDPRRVWCSSGVNEGGNEGVSDRGFISVPTSQIRSHYNFYTYYFFNIIVEV